MLLNFLLQKRLNSFSNHQYLRLVETSLLLHNIIYEQAKLQLLRRKQTTLVKIVQSLSCGNQKFKMLKLNLFKQVSRAMGAQVDDYRSQSLLVKVEQVASAKVAAMRQELEALDSQVKNFTKSFHAICKLEGEPSWDDTIRLVNDHLKKITCCRFIRQDLQLWKVDYLESSDGLYNVFLNYRSCIFQRFTIYAGKDSNVVISNKFNDIKIMKKFSDRDASTAFAFVLNAETCQKYVGPRILAQETQVTSSLLCNLVDVFDEVLLAWILLPGLAQTRFHSPSAGHLDLQFGFVDLNSGWKVNLTLDMTCLNWGVYPSDIVPYKLWANKGTARKSMAQSISGTSGLQ